MAKLIEELAFREAMGLLSLRRRRQLQLGIDVLEILLGDEHLMSDLFTESEIALARLGLDATSHKGGDVVLGGARPRLYGAGALGCKLVYALVPTPLQETVDARARKIALRALRRVAHSMKLEDQAVHDSDLERQVQNYIRNHIKDRDLGPSVTDLFDEPDDATPLAPEEREGLRQTWITLRSELNAAEQDNIVDGATWVRRPRQVRRELLKDVVARPSISACSAMCGHGLAPSALPFASITGSSSSTLPLPSTSPSPLSGRSVGREGMVRKTGGPTNHPNRAASAVAPPQVQHA